MGACSFQFHYRQGCSALLAYNPVSTALTKVSLYLHIPYCTAKCDYCDFYSVPDQINNGYIDLLLHETKRRLAETANAIGNHEAIAIPSVYIGGGTPSLLGAEGITRLLKGVRALCGGAENSAVLDAPCEITVEANPETASLSFMQACAANGVTRFSLGIQSFNDQYRKALGRQGGEVLQSGAAIQGAELLTQRLSQAAALFGRGLSVDLLCACLEKGGFNRQKDILLNDIEKTLSFEPGHISLYALSLEQNPPLAARLEKGNIIEEQTDRLWLLGRDMLVKAGFQQYEISNFALPGYRCLHNIRYWRMENWIGVGAGASGTMLNQDKSETVYGWRTDYAPDIASFLAGTPPVTEALDRLTAVKETLLMGYRYREGPDTVLFKERFGKTIEETIPKTLEKWQGKEQMLFLNAFLLDAFQEVENRI
jgi:oxygen-independent coproporphyrinogen-3 oxidase